MHIARDKKSLQAVVKGWKKDDLKIGFAPTMGALHEGHLSLVKLALDNADRCVVSIFVNPTQFAPHEDFDAYPRDEAGDLSRLEDTGAHLVYIPTREEIYPDMNSPVRHGAAAEGLEGACRPGHFEGVVNVVARLFDHVQPDLAVFGEKDYQQLQVIREMVRQYDMQVDIIPGPIIRDEEGLALSSRNAYLSADELNTARQLNKILSETANILRHCEEALKPTRQSQDCFADTRNDILENAKSRLINAGFDKVDYVAARWGRVLATVWLGNTRLIDNVPI